MSATLLRTTDRAPAKGGVLVVHGLNNRAEVMDPLVEVLVADGYDCVRASLHEQPRSHRIPPAALVQRWTDVLVDGHEQLRERHPADRVYLLAYSLGALTALDVVRRGAIDGFGRAVLIAPPVALRWWARLLPVITPLARWGAALPSAAPADCRARPATPLSEYAALLRMHAAVQTIEPEAPLGTMPTLVVIDRDDELVSPGGVRRWVERNGLDAWAVSVVEDRDPVSRSYAHLLVTEQALGPTAWASLCRRVLAHLDDPAT